MIAIVLALSLPAQAPEQRTLTPRELFYLPPQPKSVPVQTPKAGATPNPTPRPVGSGSSGGAAAVLVSAPQYAPLGLRYSLLRRTGDDQYAETSVDSIFRTGDAVRVTIESNYDAYLYIGNIGPTGNWTPLFPSPSINGNDNLVEAGRRIELPPDRGFEFNDPPGQEHLLVVLSRDVVSDLERVVQSLYQVRPTPVAEAPPAALTTQASILVGRDIRLETVDDATRDRTDRKEKAAYAVVSDTNTANRIVVDLSLNHIAASAR